MDKGTIIFTAIIAILIIHFFGLTVLLWCILAAVAIAIIIFFYMIFRDEGWVPDVEKFPKKLWRKYQRWEIKFFRWIDRNF